jgi:hypothetical protein
MIRDAIERRVFRNDLPAELISNSSPSHTLAISASRGARRDPLEASRGTWWRDARARNAAFQIDRWA